MVLRNQAVHHPPQVWTDLPEEAHVRGPAQQDPYERADIPHHRKRSVTWLLWALATAALLACLGFFSDSLPDLGQVAQAARKTPLHITARDIPGAVKASSASPELGQTFGKAGFAAAPPRAAGPPAPKAQPVRGSPTQAAASARQAAGKRSTPLPKGPSPTVATAQPSQRRLPPASQQRVLPAAGANNDTPGTGVASAKAKAPGPPQLQRNLAPLSAGAAKAGATRSGPSSSPANSTAFDWRVYSWMYPELNLTTERQARQHYDKRGRAEGKCGSPVPAVLRYPMHSGLANQLYMHLTVLAVAEYLAQHGLPVEALLPPAVQRAGVAEAEASDVESWEDAPPGTLLNVQRMVDYWRRRGVVLSAANASYPVYDAKNGLHLFYGNATRGCRSIDVKNNLWMAYDEFTSKLAARWRKEVCPSARGSKVPSCMELHFPQPLFLINSSSARPDTTVAAEGIFFAPQMERMAATIVQRLQSRGPTFNGAYLQLDQKWAATGKEADLKPFLDKMASARFNKSIPVYIASGVFSYWDNREVGKLERVLVKHGLCSSMQFKREILGLKSLEGLSSEQGALIDLLVLSKAAVALGSSFDTFSWYLRELRALHGHPRATFYAVESPHPKAAVRQTGVLAFSRGLRQALGLVLLGLPLDSSAGGSGLRFSRGLREAH